MQPIDPTALNRHRQQRSTGSLHWLRIVFLLFTLVAAAVAGYLTTMKLTGQISELAGCGGAGGCGSVLRGRWANWLLVPVSLWALILYLGLIILGVIGFQRPISRQLAFAGTSVLAAAAVWFLGLQLFVAQQVCYYCIVMHGCGVMALATAGFLVARDPLELARALKTGIVAAFVAMTALITGQLFGPQPASHAITNEALAEGELSGVNTLSQLNASGDAEQRDEPLADSARGRTLGQSGSPRSATLADSNATATDLDGSRSPDASPELGDDPVRPSGDSKQIHRASRTGRVVQFFNGKIRFPIDRVPCVGDRSAPHVVVKYFDYTCGACRRMHNDLAKLQEKWPQQIVVVTLPCPLHRDCNPHMESQSDEAAAKHQAACALARLALAVFRADAEQFPAFHDELFRTQGRMTIAAARIVAEQQVGEQALEQALEDPEIDKMLSHAIKIYGGLRARNPQMPKLLLGGTQVLHGAATDSQAFVTAVEKRLGLTASAAETDGSTNLPQ